jgi:hypothetical protein
MAPGSNGSGSGYTDDDLLASLASFGVEGQTERDLATIKAMFAASSAGNSSDSAKFNQGGYTGGWAIPQQQQSWQQYQYQHQQQPPPNTPTFSKSLELQGGNFDNNGYYPNGPYFDISNGQHSSNKRRDVSLDRDYLRSLSSAGDGRASTSNSMDMDESSEDQTNGHHYNHQQQQDTMASSSRNGRQRPSLSHNRTPSIDLMEDIPEDEGQYQTQQTQQQQQQISMPFASTSPPSRTSEKLGSAGSPASSGGKRIDPPMTRSRTRQQQHHVFGAS